MLADDEPLREMLRSRLMLTLEALLLPDSLPASAPNGDFSQPVAPSKIETQAAVIKTLFIVYFPHD